jgi:hypothetical protein
VINDVLRIAVMSLRALSVNNGIAFGVRMAGLLYSIEHAGRAICSHCSYYIIINMESLIVCTYMTSTNRHLQNYVTVCKVQQVGGI